VTVIAMTRLLRVEEAAALLGVSRARCYELVRSGALPAVHIGRQVRFDPAKLQEWMANGGYRLDR
jgi:excisionase family DNA binding protein